MSETIELKLLLSEFNWRWKAYLKNQYTQQQFSRNFRKFIKKRIEELEAKKTK